MIPLRLMLIGGAAAALVLGAGGLYLKARSDAAREWKGRLEAAQKQAALNDVSTQAVDRYHENTVIIRERADRAVQTVQQAPGAANAVDPDRRAIVCASLERVRGSAVCLGDSAQPAPLPEP